MSAVRVVCKGCRAIYNVPVERVTAPVVQATCKVCGGVIEIRHPDHPSSETTDAESSFEPDAPTRQQQEVFSGDSNPLIAPIPRDPKEEPTGSWQKALIDNKESEELVTAIEEGTLPPGPIPGPANTPAVQSAPPPATDPTPASVPSRASITPPPDTLGDLTISDPEELDHLYPDANPQPPDELRPRETSQPASASAQSAPRTNKSRRRRRRRKLGLLRLMLIVLGLVGAVFGVFYFFGDRISAAL